MFTSILLVCLTASVSFAKPIPSIASSSTAPTPTSTDDPSASLYPPGETISVNPIVPQNILNQLELASTQVDRFAIIKDLGPEYIKFDFNVAANPGGGVSSGLGGQGNLANKKTFPAVTKLGLAMSAGFLNPCGMNTPHIHPRASEFLTIVEGGNVRTGFILENGLTTQMSATLERFQGVILPQGSIHFEFNDNCKPAVFMAAFSDDDPGLSSIAQNFFSLDPGIVDADLGYPAFLDHTNIGQFETSIPKSFAQGMKSCFDRCGIVYQT